MHPYQSHIGSHQYPISILLVYPISILLVYPISILLVSYQYPITVNKLLFEAHTLM